MSTWLKANPATEDQLTKLLSGAWPNSPAAYVEYLRVSNGGEGDLGVEPGWVSIWPAETVRQNNAGYEVAKWLPGFFGFGSNGGGELLAFDMRVDEPYPVVMVPFIPMTPEEAVRIADSFDDFRRTFGFALTDAHE